MNYNRFPLFLALVRWPGFVNRWLGFATCWLGFATRWLGFAIPTRRVLGFVIPLLLLTACSGGQREHMHDELLRARAMNKAFEPFTTDSVMREVADWYDRHGTPNERMEAHYLLGCTYRDMGEAPRAVDCYLDAAACADTTAADCDFWMMASVYGQLATLYHQQLLLTYETEARHKARHCNNLAKDTLYALFEQKMIASAYILQNKRDSAELILNDVINLYRKRGREQEALQASTMLMNILIDSLGRQKELKQLIDSFDTNYKLFDENHELPPSARLFYYYKGAYFENTILLDSAEYYYRKSYAPGRSATAHEPAYKGLFSVYSKLGLSDSIVKYAWLYCEANDSSITLKDQQLTALMAASYNYQHYQAEALQNAEESNRHLIVAIILLVITIILFAVNINYKAVKKDKQRQLEIMRLKYDEVKSLYKDKLKQMELQEAAHRELVISLTVEKDKKQEELSHLQYENADAQRTINIINEQHEEYIRKYEAEIESYKVKMVELSQQARIAGERENYNHFLERPIVKRIKIYAKKRNKTLSDNEMALLEETVNEYYPDLACDLYKTTNIKNLDMQVCLLVLLNIGNKEIMQLLNISDKQVSNLKKDINNALFNNNTARNLYKNLTSHYTFIYD